MLIFNNLIDTVGKASRLWTDQKSLESVFEMGDLIHPEMMKIHINDADIPWGRYLIHGDPDGRFNIQLDVFSSDYTGSCHAHETWGAFWLLRGKLRVWDYGLEDDTPQVARYSLFGPGGFQCFAPPTSDWHKVGTPQGQKQTVSIHIYGPGFDLEKGLALGEDGRIKTYTRSAFKDLSAALPAFTIRG